MERGFSRWIPDLKTQLPLTPLFIIVPGQHSVKLMWAEVEQRLSETGIDGDKHWIGESGYGVYYAE